MARPSRFASPDGGLRLGGLLFLSVLVIAGCAPRVAHLDSRGTPIVCFGDSLTEGVGASPGRDYPALLAQRLGVAVINAGVSGETTRDGLRRVERDALRHQPKLVIVEFGANDFLQQLPLEETFHHLEQIVARIHAAGAMVALVEVRVGWQSDEQSRRFRRLARARRCLLIPHILRGIVADPQLKSDTIHPNDAGYALMASRIAEAVEPLLARNAQLVAASP